MQKLRRGQRLAGRFTLVSLIGRGNASEVWLADNAELKERVALKIIPKPVREAARAQLQREVNIDAQLQHPNIRRLYALHEDEHRLMLAQAYVAGGTLEQFKGRSYRWFVPELRNLTAALAFAHERGVVHRDLKLSNVLIGEDGRLQLGDFGVAAALRAGAEAGFGGGSPYSMSPQQYRGEAPAPADDLYGLGVLIYELIQGAPPFHGELDANSLLSKAPPPPRGDHDVPAALTDLVMQLLAKDADDRPELAAVRATLDALLAGADNATLPPENIVAVAADTAGFEPIVPVQLPDVAPAAAAGRAARRAALSGGTTVLLFWYLLVGVGAVFYFLPRLAADAKPDAETLTAVADEPAEIDEEALPEANEPWRLAQLAHDREMAEQTLTKLLDRQLDLESRGVENWGKQELAAAKQQAVQGDAYFKRLLYAKAQETYLESLGKIEALHERADQMVATANTAGEAALAAGDDKLAIAEFDKALAIDVRDARALTGKEKAGRLREVERLLAVAREFERTGNGAAARETYREVLNLESGEARAKAGLARLDRRAEQGRFQRAMSRGLAALERGDEAAARDAFAAAQALRPGAPEVDEALQQLGLVARQKAAGSLRATAEQHEAAERWQAAADAYGQVLAQDPSLVFAQQGRQRNLERAGIERDLDAYLQDRDRLANDTELTQAKSLVSRLESRTDLTPRARVSLGELKIVLASARTPVKVRLLSDNQTEVSVYQVDRLGRFELRELELVPGKYTAVGTRRGFRDVRRVFSVVAGESVQTVEIRCEERI